MFDEELLVGCSCATQEKVKRISKIQDQIQIVTKSLFGRQLEVVEKADDPFKKADFVKLELRLAKKLQTAFGKASKEEFKQIKKLIRNLNVADEASLSDFIDSSRIILAGLDAKVATAVAPVLSEGVEKMYKAAKKQSIKNLFDRKLSKSKKFDFTLADDAAVEALNLNNGIYIKESIAAGIDGWDENSKKVIAKGLLEGKTRKDMAFALIERFDLDLNDSRYWNIVSSHWMNKSRNWSALRSFDDVEIEEFEILAVIDRRTSAICRAMNGKRFSVSKQLDVLDKAARSESLEDLKRATPWLTTRGKDGDAKIGYKRGNRFVSILGGEKSKSSEKIVKAGVAMPPYHGLCRTTVVAVG